MAKHNSTSELETPMPQSKRRFRWKVLLRRIALGIGGIFVVLLGVGYVYEQLALRQVAAAYRPPGKLVDIGGRRIHIHVEGEGTPTVILESGLGSYSLSWKEVVPEIAKFTQVVSYDRAGLGWSDPSPHVRDSEGAVADLKAALAAAEISGPFVLVGHSLGGVYVRHFAYDYPNEVAGMVLVDSSHEEQLDRLPLEAQRQLAKLPNRIWLASQAARFGLVRMYVNVQMRDGNRNATGQASLRFLARRSQLFAAYKEAKALSASLSQTKEAMVPWQDLPLHVLTAGDFEGNIPQDFPVAEFQQAWEEMQSELVSRSPRGKWDVIEDAPHNIQAKRPDAVIDAVRRVVDEVRRDAFEANDDSTR